MQRSRSKTGEIAAHLPDFKPHSLTHGGDGAHDSEVVDALTGTAVFAAIGSGKSSGSTKHLAPGYLAAGFGALVLCAKGEGPSLDPATTTSHVITTQEPCHATVQSKVQRSGR